MMKTYGDGLAAMEDLFLQSNQELVDHITRHAGEPINLSHLLSSYLFNLLATLVSELKNMKSVQSVQSKSWAGYHTHVHANT